MEVNNYYPYGLLNSSLSYSRSGNRYKYQTKEVDNYFDYNILDFGARHYDPATARWTAYDPASQYATPYISMGGNPVSGIDPDGRKSRQPTDAEASIAAAEQQIAANDNTSSNGFGGGSERYLALARAAGIGLQYGESSSVSFEFYQAIDGGGIHANIADAYKDAYTNYRTDVINYNASLPTDLWRNNITDEYFRVSSPGYLPRDLLSSKAFTSSAVVVNYREQGGGTNFSLAGMYEHFQMGGGKEYQINASSIDFSSTNQSELGLNKIAIGQTLRKVNLFNSGVNPNSLAFGKLTMTRISDTKFSIADNRFDFDYKPEASWQRNAGTFLAGAINYNLMISPAAALVPLIFGGPYWVHFNGTVTIPK